MFLVSVPSLKNECFYSDSEAISHNLGLQPPTLPLMPFSLENSHCHAHTSKH